MACRNIAEWNKASVLWKANSWKRLKGPACASKFGQALLQMKNYLRRLEVMQKGCVCTSQYNLRQGMHLAAGRPSWLWLSTCQGLPGNPDNQALGSLPEQKRLVIFTGLLQYLHSDALIHAWLYLFTTCARLPEYHEYCGASMPTAIAPACFPAASACTPARPASP
eukprot:1151457-Pelagomonas_calceolata.AAC.8